MDLFGIVVSPEREPHIPRSLARDLERLVHEAQLLNQTGSISANAHACTDLAILRRLLVYVDLDVLWPAVMVDGEGGKQAAKTASDDCNAKHDVNFGGWLFGAFHGRVDITSESWKILSVLISVLASDPVMLQCPSSAIFVHSERPRDQHQLQLNPARHQVTRGCSVNSPVWPDRAPWTSSARLEAEDDFPRDENYRELFKC